MSEPLTPLKSAAAAIKAGDRERARQALLPIVRANPQDGEAWYLLAQVLDDQSQREECLRRAAAAGFAPPRNPPASPPREPAPIRAEPAVSAASPARSPQRTRIAMFLVALFALFGLGIGLGALMQRRSPASQFAFSAAGLAAAPTRTATPRRTPAPSPTAAPPSPTATPAATASPTVAELGFRTSLVGHESVIWDVAWSPDSQRIASASNDGTGRIWLPDGTLVATLSGHTSGVWTVAWSPDGATLATASDDGSVRLWGADGAPRSTLQGHTHWVVALGWSPDGATLASGSADGTVWLWNADGTPRATIDAHANGVQSVAWSPNGQLLASAGYEGAVRLWNLDGTPARVLEGHTNRVFNLAWSPDGQSLASASGDGTARVWRADGSPLHTLQGHAKSVTTLAWRRDGQLLATGSDDSDIRLWNADGALAATLSGHRSVVRELAWSADGETLASASLDGTVRLWQYDGAALAVVNGHTDRVHAVAWSPQGQTLASSSEDKTVRIWDDGSGGNQPPIVNIPGADPDPSVGLNGSLSAYAEPGGLFTISVPASWSMAERTVESGLIEHSWRLPDQPGHGELFVVISNGTTQPHARTLMDQVVADRYVAPYRAVPKKQLDLGVDSQYRALIYAANGIGMQADVTAQRVGPYLVIMGIHGPEDQMKAAKERVGDIMGSLQVDPAAKAPEIGIK